MNRGRIGKVLVSLCLTLLLIGLNQGAAHAQTKLVKPAGGGTIKITKAGSYFLAANLSTALLTTSAIAVSTGVNNVTINLNGFSIIGPGGAGSAGGINASSSSGVTIVNGTITKIAGKGIILGTNSMVAGVQLIGNAGDGVICTSGCLVVDSIINGNTGTGLSFGDTTSGYQNNIISGNGATVTSGTNMGHNVCNGTATCP
jgi:hypothetical protein